MNIPHSDDDAELRARFGDAVRQISRAESPNRVVVLEREHRRRPVRARRSMPKVFAAAASLLVIGGIVIAHQALAPAPASSATKSTSVVYTAAMVQQMAAATRAAVARSGVSGVHFVVTLSGDNETLQVATGTESTMFFGSDIAIDAQYSMDPGSQSGGATAYSATLRIIAGRQYGLYKGAWYLFPSGPSAVDGMLQPDTDPRTFLQTLSPAARFQLVDRETVGGVALTHLRAGNRNLTIPIEEHATVYQAQADGKDVVTQFIVRWVMQVSALDLWVDSAGIVHRMDLTSSISTNSMTTSPASVPDSSPAETMTQVMSITFSQLGAHEIISTPVDAHTGPPAGCSSSEVCADPRYPTIPPAPLHP
jgi:hypothetical protein